MCDRMQNILSGNRSPLACLSAAAAFLMAASMVNHGLVDSSWPAGPGLTLDESFNIEQGVILCDAIAEHGPLLWTPSVAREVFGSPEHLPDHPPLGRLLLGAAHAAASWLIPGTENCLWVVPAARLGSCLAFSLTVFLLTEFVRRRFDRQTAVCSALMLMSLPHLLGHARIAALESATNLAWIAALLPLLSGWTGPQPPTTVQALGSGALWGLLLLTKVQGIFLPPIVFLWSVWHFGFRAVRPMLLWGMAGSLVFFAGWPWLWQDPLAHILQYLGRTTERPTLYCWYFGERFPDKSVPWHFPFLMTAFALPGLVVAGLLARCVGRWQGIKIEKPEQLLILSTVFPLVVFAMPGVPVYDGTRLFLIVMPSIAVLAARGWSTAVDRLRSSSRLPAVIRRCLPGISVMLLFAVPLVHTMHPLAISRYGLLAGGNRGAAWLGLEAGYWCDALNGPFWEQVPEDSEVFVAPVSHQFQLQAIEYLVPIVQHRRIHLRAWRYGEVPQHGLLLLIHRLADLRPELTHPPEQWPVVAEVRNSGVTYARLVRVPPPAAGQRPD